MGVFFSWRILPILPSSSGTHITSRLPITVVKAAGRQEHTKMPIIQPLPLWTQTKPSPSPQAVVPRPFPSHSLDPKDRLCWVSRESKTSHQQYLWPALYYVNWAEACHELSQVLTPDENKEMCLQLYSRGKVSPTTVVAQLLLGESASSSSGREIEFVEIHAGSDAVFGQFFGGYFAQAMQTASNPSCFDLDKEWQLQFRHAVDQAVCLSNGETVTEREERPSGVMPAADEATTPSEASVAQEAPKEIPLSDPSPRLTTISPSSSQHETPTHSNKSSHHTIMEQHEQEQEPKEQEQRTLFPRSLNTMDDDSSSSLSPSTTNTATTAALTKVTPCRVSSRSRRKAVHKTDRLTPTCSKPNKSLKRRHDDDDDGEFYAFKPLIALLTKELRWSYRSARDSFHTWVYLRPGKDEKNGNLLEDYFYEEYQVVEFCKANNYKQKYQHLIDDPSCITPSPRKEARSSTV
jgi:hypothetical protein